MDNIIDIHNHVLYEIDDGANTIEESVEILSQEYKQGVRQVILTPHYKNGSMMTEQKKINVHFNILKDRISEIFPDMKMFLGQEIYVDTNVVDWIKSGRVNTMADSKYILMEFALSISYNELISYIQQTELAGFRPIIAHCERYICLRKRFGKPDFEHIMHLKEMGAYMQINTECVMREKKFTYELIDRDALDFIASDAHNTTNRGVHFDECIKILHKKYNREYIKMLLVDNPQKIINNEYI